MHVILVSKLSGSGGVAVYNRTLAAALVKQGHRVSLITTHSTAQKPIIREENGAIIHLLPSVQWGRISAIPLIGRHLRSLGQLLHSYRVARYLQYVVTVSEPAVVEFAEVEGEGFAYLRQRQRLPVVVRCHTPTFILRRYHSAEEMPFSTRLTEVMEKYAIRKADLLTAPSHHMAATVAQATKTSVENYHVIPNAVDVDSFATDGNQSNRNSGGQTTTLHVGRLERIKGIGTIAAAIPLVLSKCPDTRFVFLGAARSDRQSMYWTERLQAAGGSQVSVLGFVPNEEMIEWYRKADIAIVPSLNYESFSYTCAQAMAAGLPVVASRIGGIPETVEDGREGLLIEPGNADDLAESLITLLQDVGYRKQLGQAGKNKALVKFAADNVAQEMVNLYQMAVARRNND